MKSGRSAVHAEDVGIVFLVGTEEECDDLGVVKVAFREERAQRAVGHPAGEDLFFGGAAFTLEVATREATGCGGFLFVFDGKGEPVLALADFGLGDGGDKDDGLAGRHSDGAIGELAHFAGFNGHRELPDFAGYGFYTHGVFSFVSSFLLADKKDQPTRGAIRFGASAVLRKCPTRVSETKSGRAAECCHDIPERTSWSTRGFGADAKKPVRRTGSLILGALPLATETERADQFDVALVVIAVQVVEELAAAGDKLEQAAS